MSGTDTSASTRKWPQVWRKLTVSVGDPVAHITPTLNHLEESVKTLRHHDVPGHAEVELREWGITAAWEDENE